MKLAPEQTDKINTILTFVEECNGHRATIIEFGLPDLVSLSMFLSVLRAIGMDIPKQSFRGLSKKDKADFIKWLREKKASETARASA